MSRTSHGFGFHPYTVCSLFFPARFLSAVMARRRVFVWLVISEGQIYPARSGIYCFIAVRIHRVGAHYCALSLLQYTFDLGVYKDIAIVTQHFKAVILKTIRLQHRIYRPEYLYKIPAVRLLLLSAHGLKMLIS